jgi:hypothetical protein
MAGTRETGTRKIGTDEAWTREAGAREAGAREVGAREAGAREARAGEAGTGLETWMLIHETIPIEIPLAQQFQPNKPHTLYLLLHILYHAPKSSLPSITSTTLKMLR